eukprot:CAMPEP_0171456040 /NCGR_PEP_ID=MMETSP0945-20130129/2692_1 /TAXON_ID=109269 /ORGANISM="Vaucheria litorea, Strain CCMP2940" /LENGTH=182 /DNA_ID=CAMNT_0011981397 /DNA_START=29 /DNA_END=575 /DNA_ORIENTATION=-
MTVIAIDVDEVLCDFLPTVAEWHNEVYHTDFHADQFFTYEFHTTWGGSKEASDEKMHEFFQSEKFLNGVPVVEGARHILSAHCHEPASALADLTEKWLLKNFGSIFKTINFGNLYGSEGLKRNKSEMCRDVGAEVIIDDSLKYALECSKLDMAVILFGNYAWNKSHLKLPENVHRASTWAEV